MLLLMIVSTSIELIRSGYSIQARIDEYHEEDSDLGRVVLATSVVVHLSIAGFARYKGQCRRCASWSVVLDRIYMRCYILTLNFGPEITRGTII